jgi:hypothetical protein
MLEETAGDFKPAQAGHLNVEKYEIRLVLLNRTDCLDPIARLRHDLDAVDLLELIAELFPSEPLIVHDDYAQCVIHSLPLHRAFSIGH